MSVSRSSAPVKDERERRRRIRESVRSYYEVETPAASSSGGAGRPSASPTTAQQASSQQRNNTSASMDIDSTAFNPTAYTTALLRQSTLPSLLETDTVLRRSVKALDGELQDLVYSNYSKFIHAAETIKEVRTSVKDMEGKLQDLDNNVDQMEKVSGRVAKELERHRHLVDQEVATNSMLRKVQFLSLLPQVMASAAQAERYVEAANYWAAGDAIFSRYSEFPSFGRTQQECRLRAEELYASVSNSICNCGIETLTPSTDKKGDSSSSAAASPAAASAAGSPNNANSGNREGGEESSGGGRNNAEAGAGGGAGAALQSALKSKLAALRILAGTSVDVQRLRDMGVQLLPPESEMKKAAAAAAAAAAPGGAPLTFDGDQVTVKASQLLSRRLISAFKEQIDDAVAHTKLDFMRRKEDLDRHAKRVRQRLVEKQQTTGAVGDSASPAAAAAEVQSSLMDLSVALRTRTIAKLEDVMVAAFRNLSLRMSVVNGVCAESCSNNNSNLSNTEEHAEDQGQEDDDNCSSKNKKRCIFEINVAEVLEPALSRFLDEVCAATTQWIAAGVDTFAGCIVNAANVCAEQGGRPLLSICVADVETTISAMVRTFLDAIYDTERSFCSISDRFLHQKDETKSTFEGRGGGGGASSSVAAKFNSIKVAKKTRQLLADFENLFATAAALTNNRRKLMELASSGGGGGGGGEEEGAAADADISAKFKKTNIQAVPILCNAAIARACAAQLAKSELAARGMVFRADTETMANGAASNSSTAGAGSASGGSGGMLDWGDDDEAPAAAANNTSMNSQQQHYHLSASKLLSHQQMFQGAAAALSNLYVRTCGLFCLTELARPALQESVRFCDPRETPDPAEPSSELAVPLVKFIRVQTFVIQLLLGDAVSSAGSNGSGHKREISNPTSSTAAAAAAAASAAPLVAQFTRRDATATLRADMDKMFAARAATAGSGSAASAAAGGAVGSNTNTAQRLSNSAMEVSANSGPNSNQVALHQQLLVPRGPGGWFSSTAAAGLSSLPMCNSVVDAILMYIMAALVETVREMPRGAFVRNGFQQMQVDVSLLLHLFADMRSSNGLVVPDEVSTAVVTELLCCAFDRTDKDRTPLPNAAIEHLAGSRWKILRSGR